MGMFDLFLAINDVFQLSDDLGEGPLSKARSYLDILHLYIDFDLVDLIHHILHFHELNLLLLHCIDHILSHRTVDLVFLVESNATMRTHHLCHLLYHLWGIVRFNFSDNDFELRSLIVHWLFHAFKEVLYRRE